MKKITITFYVKKDKINHLTGEVAIYARINTEGTSTTFSTNKWTDGKRWKETKQFSKSRDSKERVILSELNDIKVKIEYKEKEFLTEGIELTAENLKNSFLGKAVFAKAKSVTFMEAFEFHNKNFQIKINNGERAKASLTKFNSTQTHLKAFIRHQYNADDIALFKLNYEFVDKFDTFLRTEKAIENNTTVKYVQAANKITNLAIKYEWLDKNPFARYEGKLIIEDAIHLTQEELERIENKVFSTERLNIVKDIFLFSCYTSYGPADVKKLTRNDIVNHIDGELWIITERQKTKVESNVPLLPKAKRLIEKYKNHPQCIADNTLLPIRSNQKVNEYLKEIADLCGINKTLHYYVARHTFACWALENGVPLEVVSRIMGHKRITQTQHYAKLKDNRVSQEMQKLIEKINKKEQEKSKDLPDNPAVAG